MRSAFENPIQLAFRSKIKHCAFDEYCAYFGIDGSLDDEDSEKSQVKADFIMRGYRFIS